MTHFPRAASYPALASLIARRLRLSAAGGLAAALAATGCEQTNAGTQRATATPSALASDTAQVIEPPVADEPDPGALEELLLAVPTDRPVATRPDGGTLVSSDTGEPSDGGVVIDSEQVAPAPRQPPRVRAGEMDVHPGMSSPAIERAARAQFYWPLVQKCRGPDGELLPPDTVTLAFTIRSDGTVDPASVSATASDHRFDAAAECMMREFSALPFRPPPAAVGRTPRVIATLPSVD